MPEQRSSSSKIIPSDQGRVVSTPVLRVYGGLQGNVEMTDTSTGGRGGGCSSGWVDIMFGAVLPPLTGLLCDLNARPQES